MAPWRSVYKIHSFADTEVTCVLTSGGHNAGIVSEPGHPNRSYRIATQKEGDPYIDHDNWQAKMPVHEGSWCPALQTWLKEHSSKRVLPPSLGTPERGYPPLDDAPGTCVLEE